MSTIINCNFGEIKEVDEEEGVTHDWIRIAKPNQADAELADTHTNANNFSPSSSKNLNL